MPEENAGVPTFDWEKDFPFDVIRPQQRRAIDFTFDAFLNKRKRIVVAELPVGSGKSAIAMTVARYLAGLGRSSYFLTTQKVLQQQYIRDFAHVGLTELKSASSYTCQKHQKGEPKSCLTVRQLLRSKKEIRPLYRECTGGECYYQQAKEAFFEAHMSVTNYAYMLNTNAHSPVKFPPRELLVLDEGHNINDVVTSFIQVAFSNRFYKRTLEVKMPRVDAGQDEVYRWLSVTCRNKLRKAISSLREKVEASEKGTESEQMLSEELEDLEKHWKKLEYFMLMYDERTWVLDVSKTDTRGERIYAFKPINVERYVRELLLDYAQHILVLSATIIDVEMFCVSNGFSMDDVEFISLPSAFPVENRIVNVLPVGSMSRKSIESTLPNLVETVRTLLEGHRNEKGIIHANSFKIAQYLQKELQDDRILIHDSFNRNEVLERHLRGEEPTVLLSPSMTEGVDLYGDLSRFQIICKVPFPYLGDAMTVKKMELNDQWYPYQTAKTLIQALGRSVRSESDFAVSYILDSDFSRFYGRHGRFFPSDFEHTLRF